MASGSVTGGEIDVATNCFASLRLRLPLKTSSYDSAEVAMSSVRVRLSSTVIVDARVANLGDLATVQRGKTGLDRYEIAT